MEVYVIPKEGRAKRLKPTQLEARAATEDDQEDDAFWIGDANPSKYYARGVAHQFKQLADSQYLSFELQEVGLDMIQLDPLHISVGYYAEQSLMRWPRQFHFIPARGTVPFVSLVRNTNVLAVTSVVPDVGSEWVPTSLFPAVVKKLHELIDKSSVLSLAGFLVEVLDLGLKNERVQLFTELLIESLSQ